MCFVWIWEQTAIISLYSINWLVFITETECVYCAVRTGSLYTASLTFSNSTFCPHTVVMCFVWIWEQTTIISLHNINWLAFITETECVYCAVRTRSLYTASLTFRNSAFCPHTVIICFVWIWEQTAIISLYCINWLVFTTETECVYCAVRTGSLYTASLTFRNSTFCPHSVFVCFVWISKQTTIISLCNINWLVFTTETECLLRGTDWKFISIIQILAISGIIQQNAPLSDVIHGAKFISRGGTSQFVQLELAALSLAHKKRSTTVACLPDLLLVNAIRAANIRYTSQLCAVNSNPRPALIARALMWKSPVWILAQRQACIRRPTSHRPHGASVVLLQSCISEAFIRIMKWQWQHIQSLFYAS